MNKFVLSKALLVGSAGVLLAASVQAQFNPPVRGDMLFGARELNAGSAGPFDVVVDLGSYTRFNSGSAALLLGGSTANESYQGLSPLTANENRFAGSDITALFGNLDNVVWSAFGINSAAAVDNRNIFVTRARANVNVQSTPFNRNSQFQLAANGNEMQDIANNAINFGVDYSNTATREDATGANSLTVKVPFGGYNPENNTGAGFTGAAITRSDLYYLIPGTVSQPGQYMGFFEYQADGDLWFVPASFVPVPEASTYGLIAGAGLLLAAMRRKLSHKTA